jgi:hypothetical protein
VPNGLPDSWKAAHDAGEPHYFSGQPCKYGHVAKRVTRTRNCLECQRLRSAAVPRADQRARNQKSYNKNRETRSQSRKQKYEANPEYFLARGMSYRKMNRPKVQAHDRVRNRKRNTGFTPELVEQRRTEQQGLCAICQDPLPDGMNLHADHCHTSLVCRGLLCRGCNVGLGFFKDDTERLTRAIEYLNKWQKVTAPQ